MKIITIYVSEKFIEFIKELVDIGIFPSRSECIRECIMKGLDDIFTKLEKMKSFINLIKENRKLVKTIEYLEKHNPEYLKSINWKWSK